MYGFPTIFQPSDKFRLVVLNIGVDLPGPVFIGSSFFVINQYASPGLKETLLSTYWPLDHLNNRHFFLS